eukprot:2024744-Pyramimonas_sp.AAC.1
MTVRGQGTFLRTFGSTVRTCCGSGCTNMRAMEGGRLRMMGKSWFMMPSPMSPALAKGSTKSRMKPSLPSGASR